MLSGVSVVPPVVSSELSPLRLKRLKLLMSSPAVKTICTPSSSTAYSKSAVVLSSAAPMVNAPASVVTPPAALVSSVGSTVSSTSIA